jgi:hypothetical protein
MIDRRYEHQARRPNFEAVVRRSRDLALELAHIEAKIAGLHKAARRR